MFLRLPAMILIAVLIVLVLFKLFRWLLNSHFLTDVVDDVVHPRPETTEDIKDRLTRASDIRDDRVEENQAAIQDAVNENADLKQL